MKYLYTIFILLACAPLAWAQPFSVQGTVVDADDKSPLPGAYVFLSTANNPVISSGVTNGEGRFMLEKVNSGEYFLIISFTGARDTVQVSVTNQSIDLGKLPFSGGVRLDELEIAAQTTPVVQQGDTTVINASAYKTLPDANAGTLLEKMPTVRVENGEVQAQGEKVQQVLVDGKRFFGDDPNVALNTLPAAVIDKIQIFDQQSEQSQFTGFDDGQMVKTINIITKPNMRNGQFGKIYGGYGTDGRYQTGGHINFFDGGQRFSLIGMGNNINQQNFSTEDLLGVVGSSGGRRGGGRGGFGGGRGRGRGGRGGGASVNDFLVSQQGGISGTQAFGLNYSDEWGEKLEVAGSYFFNRSENYTLQSLEQQFFEGAGISQTYDEKEEINSININHRLNARVEYDADDNNSIVWRPTLSWQLNEGADSLLAQNQRGGELFSETGNLLNSDLSALKFDNRLLWRHRFEKRRRTFSVSVNTGYVPSKGDRYLSANQIFYEGDEPAIELLNQYSSLDLNSWNASANLQYTEPIGKSMMLMFRYQASFQREENAQETFDWVESESEFSLLDEELSSVFSNDYLTQNFGLGVNRRERGGPMFMVRANVQWATMANEQTFPTAQEVNNEFFNVLPMAVFRHRMSNDKNIVAVYRTSTDLPSITQLQEVVNNTNPLQLEVGNSDLRQSYQHRVFTRYSSTNTEKGSLFFALLSATYTRNYIGNSTYWEEGALPSGLSYDLSGGAQITRPENVGSYLNLRALTTYGFPVAPLKSNLNVDLSATYTETPGLINGLANKSKNTALGLGLTLSSNFSDRVDFTISSRSDYNEASSTLQTAVTSYISQSTRFRFDWVLGKSGIVFRTDINHQLYDGLSEDFDQNFVLWNMSIGKKLFKNQLGEISLSVFDLLKQNNSVARTVTETYIQDTQTNALQQYFMLSFKYDLRRFKGE